MFKYKMLDKEKTVVNINDVFDHLDLICYVPCDVISRSANIAVFDGTNYRIVKMRGFVNMTVSKDVYDKVLEKEFKVITCDMFKDTKKYTIDMLYGDYILIDNTKSEKEFTRFSSK